MFSFVSKLFGKLFWKPLFMELETLKLCYVSTGYYSGSSSVEVRDLAIASANIDSMQPIEIAGHWKDQTLAMPLVWFARIS